MKQSLRLGAACVLAAAILGCSNPSLSAKTYVVGDIGPAGGMIFYVKGSITNGWQYLEVAPSDQGTAQGATPRSCAGACP